MDVRDEKMGLGFATNFSLLEQPKANIVIKPSKIRFNFGSKTNMPIKTNRIHFAEGNVCYSCKVHFYVSNKILIKFMMYKFYSLFDTVKFKILKIIILCLINW